MKNSKELEIKFYFKTKITNLDLNKKQYYNNLYNNKLKKEYNSFILSNSEFKIIHFYGELSRIKIDKKKIDCLCLIFKIKINEITTSLLKIFIPEIIRISKNNNLELIEGKTNDKNLYQFTQTLH